MTSIALPLTGYAGWTFLQRTMDSQKALLQQDTQQQRDEAHFRDRIGSITSAADLVADRQLLKVALGAHGLQDDLANRYFIRKVLEDGTLDATDLANRLADKSYAAFSSGFGFGDYAVPRTQLSDFADTIIAQYRTRSFEVAVGEVNGDYRLALNAERELPELAADSMTEDAKWYTILGSEPLRSLFETAFGLPDSFGMIDIDAQLTMIKDRAARHFGDSSVSQFADAGQQEKLIRQFLLRSELAGLAAGGLSRAASALQILQAAG